MALIKIDGHDLEVDEGMVILEAAKMLGIDIPHYCYHPALKIVASCRMCLVKAEGFPKLIPACATTINLVPPARKIDDKYDMVISTTVKEVKDAQESIMEFLLLNHPVDCPECDQAGECHLQDYSYKYGKGYSRFDFKKRVPPRKDLGPNVLLISTRCILCSRCVRFTQEVTGTNELIVKQRGYKSEIDTFPGVSLNNKLSMNTVDICPVGALVSKDFLHKPRNWRYEKGETVCPGCSVGCNIQVEYMAENNEIYRVKPVYNEAVNQWWMCDEGRLFYHKIQQLKRLEFPQISQDGEQKKINWRDATRHVSEKLKKYNAEEIAVVGNGFATNEENYLLKKLFVDEMGVKNNFVNDLFYKTEDVKYPQFIVKGEKLPNWQGAVDMLGTKLNFKKLLELIEAGSIKAVFYLGGDPHFAIGEDTIEQLKKLELLIVQEIQETPLTQIAHLVLAGASTYEKEGTLTNYKNRVQRIRPTVMPPFLARVDFDILRDIGRAMGMDVPERPKVAFDDIASEIKGYAGMDHQNLKESGINKGEGKKKAKSVETA